MTPAVYVEGFDEEKLERATKVLAGISGGVYRAVGSALKRAAQRGLTVGMRLVSEEYAIGQNELKQRTRHVSRTVKDGASSVEVTFGYRGNVIPLIRFDTAVSGDGRVSARVLREGTRETIDGAFRATVGKHTGIFQREGRERYPIKELFGPSAVQAFYARESTVDKMSDEVVAEFDKRIEHEILRVLNGWGA